MDRNGVGLDQPRELPVDQVGGLITAPGRLRGLLDANRMLIGELELPALLRALVEAARTLVRARNGALGVLAPGGGFGQFIHAGSHDPTTQRIGPLPMMFDDAWSVGLPAAHPPMSSFLGVPVRVRGEVFGNLYLMDAASGQFSPEDEDLVTALVANAGIAIENALLFDRVNRRQGWMHASTLITRQLLSAEGEEPLHLIARQTLALAASDAVIVLLPTADGEHLMVEVAAGLGADDLRGVTYPVADTLVGRAFLTGQPALLDDASEASTYHLHPFDDNDAIFAAVVAGAAGYPTQGDQRQQPRRCHPTGRGRQVVARPRVTERLMARLRDGEPTDARIASLNPRGREILTLITDGLTNRQIGERMFLAEKTVKNYVSGLLAKLGMERRTQAAVYASEMRHT